MNVQRLKKLTIVNAVSVALLYSFNLQAEEQLIAVKFTHHNQQLVINSIFQKGDNTSAEVDLLNAVEMLPSECDLLSAYPATELYMDNPPAELLGEWTADDIEFSELEDDDGEDDDDNESNSTNILAEAESEQKTQYLSVSYEGFLIFSELVTQAGISICNSTFVGELDGDTYTYTPQVVN